MFVPAARQACPLQRGCNRTCVPAASSATMSCAPLCNSRCRCWQPPLPMLPAAPCVGWCGEGLRQLHSAGMRLARLHAYGATRCPHLTPPQPSHPSDPAAEPSTEHELNLMIFKYQWVLHLSLRSLRAQALKCQGSCPPPNRAELALAPSRLRRPAHHSAIALIVAMMASVSLAHTGSQTSHPTFFVKRAV